MAKITRKTAKIFGSSASTNQIAKFGSLAASSPVLYSGATADPANIQALANWLTGWFAGVEGASSPAIEDLNAYCYVMAYQIAYQMQTGVPEWDAGTTYYIGSMVTSSSQIYVSLTDTNLNNAVSDASKWKALTPTPSPISYTPTVVPNVGTFGSTTYQAAYQIVGNLVSITYGFAFTQSSTTTTSFTATLPIVGATTTVGSSFFQCNGPTSHTFLTYVAKADSLSNTITISGGSANDYAIAATSGAGLSNFINGAWSITGSLNYLIV